MVGGVGAQAAGVFVAELGALAEGEPDALVTRSARGGGVVPWSKDGGCRRGWAESGDASAGKDGWAQKMAEELAAGAVGSHGSWWVGGG